MRRFLVSVLGNAAALWLTTLIVAGTTVTPYAPGGVLETVLTYLLLGLLFGIVNGVIGTAIRIVAFPLYILTLGLIALIVNGLLFLLVGWISTLLGFGLSVEGFWWGVLAALVMAIFNWIIGLILRPLAGRQR
ncbi:phage holin family protein [Herbiconiux sp. L3-i23]|uniref:phage holin family protein n=1 Tax=Herbiconiux sp. L3-i23 TaxID=2905871 RepID=UPI002049C574|nr:phage holin family protein [Herbiconiux sp. L3-i23]BDI24181.1 membrane protein [Herbiconiux sp. L3-i23]